MAGLRDEFDLALGTTDPLKILLHQNCPKCDPKVKIMVDETRSHSKLLSKQIIWTWDNPHSKKRTFLYRKRIPTPVQKIPKLSF